MTYQKILVAIDDSEISINVIQQAAQLAKALNSEITVVEVMALDPYLADTYVRFGLSESNIGSGEIWVQWHHLNHSNFTVERVGKFSCLLNDIDRNF